MKHTAGPWYTEPSNFADGLEVTADARRHMVAIATIPTGYDEPVESEQFANAQLIAAAPTGLKATERAYRFLLSIHPPERSTMEGQRVLCDLRDFIAAATGRTEQEVQEEAEEAATRLMVSR